MTKARSSADFAAGGPNVAGKNFVINGGMDIWQRGTSISIGGASDGYTSDRWRLFTQSGQASTVSRQATSDTTNLPNIQYCARVQRNSGQTGTGQMSFIQGLETVNSIPFAGKIVTLSFYARAGANFSPTSSTFNFMIYTGTGTDQFPTSYTGGATAFVSTVNLTTTWTRYTVSGTIPTTATEIGVYAYWSATGTAGTNDYVEITGVQLEVGSVATPFSRAGGTIQGELAACQRYYFRFANSAATANYGLGYAYNTTSAAIQLRTPVTMRITPSTLDYSTIRLTIVGTADYSITALAIDAGTSGPDVSVVLATGASGLTQYRPYSIGNASSTAGYIGLSAEL
jgi:hypothetical protein